MESASTLGFIAGILTTVAFIPQVVKIWKSKHTQDISLGMFVIFSARVFLWLLYGVQIGATPVVIANTVTLGLALTILIFKIKYK